MGEFLQKLKGQTGEFFGSLDNKKKMMLAGGSVFVVLVIALAIYFFAQPEYVTLASELTLPEAAAITTKLDELGISWKDSENSSVIMVPKNKLTEAKMSLTVEGVLEKQDFGWTEAFANSSITMTSVEKEQMFLLAQATALADSIRSLENIEDAIVNLYIPADSSFLVTDELVSKASVVIKLEGDKTLTEKQVNGIVMILANSVKGLTPDNISIVDNYGNELNKTGSEDWMSDVNTQIEMQIAVEKQLTDDLTDFLATLYGKGNVRVLPNIKLNFDTNETVSKMYSPPVEGEVQGMIRSITEIQENVVGASANGAPGTDSNSEPTNYTEIDGQGSDYNKASSTINYEMNEIVNQISKAKGEIEDISVAVILNDSVLKDGSLTDEHEKELKQLVAASSGIDPARVEVSAMAFADSEDSYDVFNSMTEVKTGVPVWIILVVLGVVLVSGVGAFIIIRRRKKEVEEQLRLEEVQREQDELEALSAGYEDKTTPKYQIEKFIDSDPDIVAQLLRAWINED